jgi:hypothetical protein
VCFLVVAMILLAVVAVLSTTALLALRMVLKDADPRERTQLLTAIAVVVRAWRSPASRAGISNGGQQPRR